MDKSFSYPSHTHTLRVLSMGVRLGFRQVFANKILIVGAFIVYALIVLLYAGVIKLIPDADLAAFSFSKEQMIWYLCTAEMVIFSASISAFKDVQNDFLSEQVHLSLLRPYPSALVRSAMGFGESLARLAVYFPFYFALTTFLAGSCPLSPLEVAGLLLSAPMGLLIMVCGTYVVGASCLWFVQSEPAFWVWMKSIFLFGAMLWPMAFYPLWLQAIMWATPFPGTLALSANWTIGTSAGVLSLGFLHQALWAVAFVALLRWFDGVTLRRIQRKGA